MSPQIAILTYMFSVWARNPGIPYVTNSYQKLQNGNGHITTTLRHVSLDLALYQW